ncbi:hypothetical protein GF358_03185 [Candidatus Woesearchaeota archaeon]|nr:hypothetical protein [Candidatus Woesearchaeota archaeon]
MVKIPRLAAVNKLNNPKPVLCSNKHPTVLRSQRNDKETLFWGCSEYPACTQTESYTYEDKLAFIHYYNPNLKFTGNFSSKVFELKYSGRNQRLEEKFAVLLLEHIQDQIGEEFKSIDFIVTIPGHDGAINQVMDRLFQYDPLRELEYKPEMILGRPRPSQKQMRKIKNRQENVKGKFSLRDSQSAVGSKILVLDDIVTTGWSIDEVTNVLYEASKRPAYIGAIGNTRRK